MTDLPVPVVGPPAAPLGPAGAPLRLDLEHAGRPFTLRVLDVGLACCSVELMAAVSDRRLARASGAVPVEAAAPDVVVVAGTCTDAMAPALKAAYDALPQGARVVAFGACASSGGPYWDSYSVTKGVDQLLPVDLYVPGCPPRPEALLDAVLALVEAS